MRILEALEGKGSRLPLMKGEVEVAEKLAVITRQVGVPHLFFSLVLIFMACGKRIILTSSSLYS